MPLIARTPAHHTIRQFHSAAKHRHNEAVRLSTANDRLGGSYLCGYAGEMLLKAAYFRLRGWLPNASITMRDLQDARRHAITALGLLWAGGLHELDGWRDLLIGERRRRRIAYPGRFQRTLKAWVNRLMDNWRPEIRYCTNRPYAGEVNVTFAAVSWLFAQFHAL
jgi:hypothetical protein